MTDKELLYIKTIAEERSISAAAKLLYITQPALSHCLNSLEREIGQPLFVRTANGLDMTYAGECYYEMAARILDIYQEGQQKLMDIGQGRRGRVRVGMTRYLSALMLPEILPEFSSRYPEIEICLKEMNSRELEEETAARKLDFAILHRDIPEDLQGKRGLDYTVLCRDEFLILTDLHSDLADKARILPGYSCPVLDLKELEGSPMILETRNHRMRYAIDGIFRRANMEINLLLETELFETAQRLTARGMGVTLVNRRYTNFIDLSECRVFSIPKQYKPYWTMGAVTSPQSYLSLAAKKLLEMIREAAQKTSI